MHIEDNTDTQNKREKTDPLLELCKVSEPELDYVHIESLVESREELVDTASVTSKTNVALDSVRPACTDKCKSEPCSSKVNSDLERTAADAYTRERIIEMLKFHRINILRGRDILDLHRISEKFAETKRNIHTGMATRQPGTSSISNGVKNVDRLLEEAHTICDKLETKLGCNGSTRARLIKLITDMKKLPHSYDHARKRKEKHTRVHTWLKSNTHPEPDMVGFTQTDRVQIRKFIPDTPARLSTSDSNITVGKRKIGQEDCGYDDVIVCESSSDTRLSVHADWSMRIAPRKRRRVLY